MNQQRFKELKDDVMSFLKERKICTSAYKQLLEANNINTIFSVMKRYWSSLMYEHKSWVTALIEKYYPLCKDEANSVNFFFNESGSNGLVFLSDSAEIELSGNAEIYAIGNSKYKADGHVKVYAYDQSDGVISGNVKAVLNDNASCKAYGLSTVTANGNNIVTVDGSVTVFAGSTSRINAIRWKRIVASGNSVISAPVNRGIELSGGSTYIKLV